MIGWEEVVVRTAVHVLLRSIDAGVIGLVMIALLRLPSVRMRMSPFVAHALLWVGLLHFALPRVPSLSFVAPPLLSSAGRSALPGVPPIALNDGAVLLGSVIYIVGLAGVLAVVLRQQRRVRRWIRDDLPASTDVEQRFAALTQCMGLRSTPRLVVSRSAPTPMAVGLWRPTVIIPYPMLTQLEPREIDDVLVHELTHLRARDPWLSAACVGIVALWWFHPVVWMLARQQREVREECCDEAVLAKFHFNPSRYARTLVHAAHVAASTPGPQWIASGVVGGHQHPLVTRLRRLNSGGNARRRLPLWGWALGLVLLAGLALSQPVDAVHRVVTPGHNVVYLHGSESDVRFHRGRREHSHHKHEHNH